MKGVLRIKGFETGIDNINSVKNIIGVIEYGRIDSKYSYYIPDEVPYLFIEVENTPHNFTEVWFTDEEVRYEKNGRCYIAQSPSFTFMSVVIEKEGRYKECANEAYQYLFKALDKERLDIIRFWNYVPFIDIQGESENGYKEFCIGREQAFTQYYHNNSSVYPAATGIGYNGDSLRILLLGANKDYVIKNIENPRQTPAYDYPQRYGYYTPKFARATYIDCITRKYVLVSGTASIINSETVYVDDIVKQTITTIENINILLSSSNLEQYGIYDSFSAKELRYIKVYIKNWEDYPTVKEICENNFSENRLIYMQADICRSELLVEMEGVYIRDSY